MNKTRQNPSRKSAWWGERNTYTFFCFSGFGKWHKTWNMDKSRRNERTLAALSLNCWPVSPVSWFQQEDINFTNLITTRASQDFFFFLMWIPLWVPDIALCYCQALERSNKQRRGSYVGILSPAVSYLLFHLELEEADPSAVPKTYEGWLRIQRFERRPQSIWNFAETAEMFSSEPFHHPTWEGDYGSHCCTNEKKWRHRLEMWLICLEPDRAKMALEIIYANSSLTCLPPNTKFLPRYLLLCQITRQHTATYPLQISFFFLLTASG